MKLFLLLVAVLVVVLVLNTLSAIVRGAELEEKHEYQANEVINKSPEELIQLRGFNTETHFVNTKDGYSIHTVRIINPNIEAVKRPVLFNHGFIESSTIWLIESRLSKPLLEVEDVCSPVSGDKDSTNLPMMLSNRGYDVWLMSFRGTDWSLQLETRNKSQPDFWDFSLDDFAQTDVPTVVDFVREYTGFEKIGYIGHSQASFSVFGLLSLKPEYADRIEPVVGMAPITFLGKVESTLKALMIGANARAINKKNGPFPKSAEKLRRSLSKICNKSSLQSIKFVCQIIERTAVGKGKNLKNGYFAHLPFFSSFKILRHFGQLIKSNQMQMYDYGQEENIVRYNSAKAPRYPIENIKSESLVLVNTNSDNLSEPKGVQQFIRTLKVPVFKQIFIREELNHLDMIVNSKARELIFDPLVEIFESFEHKNGFCAADSESKSNNSNADKVHSNEIPSD